MPCQISLTTQIPCLNLAKFPDIPRFLKIPGSGNLASMLVCL